MPKLFYHPVSGHAHRAQLMLGLLGLEVELVMVDLSKRDHKSPGFLALNPFGQVPVFVDDDGTVIADSNAILVYLASKHARGDWLPTDAAGAARVQRWLSVAAGELAGGPARARLIVLFGLSADADEAITKAHAILHLVEDALGDGERNWIAADRPTIADVALYSYIARAGEGNVDLTPYPAIRRWLNAVEGLPGFVPMPINRVGLEA